MHCRRAEERLQDLLDARRPFSTDRALSQHLRECPACQERALAYEQLARCVAAPRHPATGLNPANARAPGRWVRYPAPAALAAALTGLALWMPQFFEQRESALAQRKRASDLPAIEIPQSLAAPAQDQDLLAHAALTQLTALAPVSISVLNLDAPATLPWVAPVSGGFRPVTRSVEAAFGAMRDTMLWTEPTSRS